MQFLCVSSKHVRIYARPGLSVSVRVYPCVCLCVKSDYSRVAFYEAANILLHVLNWAAPSLCVSVCFCLRLLKFQHWCQVSLPAACSDDASAVSAVTVTVCVFMYVCTLSVLYFIAEKCNHKTFKGLPLPLPLPCLPCSQCSAAISKGKSALKRRGMPHGAGFSSQMAYLNIDCGFHLQLTWQIARGGPRERQRGAERRQEAEII